MQAGFQVELFDTDADAGCGGVPAAFGVEDDGEVWFEDAVWVTTDDLGDRVEFVFVAFADFSGDGDDVGADELGMRAISPACAAVAIQKARRNAGVAVFTLGSPSAPLLRIQLVVERLMSSVRSTAEEATPIWGDVL